MQTSVHCITAPNNHEQCLVRVTMADDAEYDDEEGSYTGSGSYSHDGSYYSDDRSRSGGSYDSRDAEERSSVEDGSRSYGRRSRQDGEFDDGIDEASHSQYSDERSRSEHSGSASYYSGSQRSGSYSQRSGSYSQRSGSYSQRSGSQSSQSGRSGSQSDRSHSQRSYEDEGSYSQRSPGKEEDFSSERSPDRYGDEQGSYSGRPEDERYDDDRGSRGGSDSFDDEQGSNTGSQHSGSHDGDGQGSYTGSQRSGSQYDDERGSYSGSYSDKSPSRSYDDDGDEGETAPADDFGDEDAFHDSAFGDDAANPHGFDSGGDSFFGNTTLGQSINSSTPSFAIDTGSSEGDFTHYSMNVSSQLSMKAGPQNAFTAEAFVEQDEEEETEDDADSPRPEVPATQDRKLPYHQNMSEKDAYDSSNSGFSGGDSFANETDHTDGREEEAQDQDDFYENHVPAFPVHDDDRRVHEGSQSTYKTEDTSINSQLASPQGKARAAVGCETKSLFAEAQSQDDGEYEMDEEEYESDSQDDDSFYQKSLISKEPDMLPKITEHSVEQGDNSSSQMSNQLRKIDNKDVTSVNSFQTSEHSRSLESRSDARSIRSGRKEPVKRGTASSSNSVASGESKDKSDQRRFSSYSREQMQKVRERRQEAEDSESLTEEQAAPSQAAPQSPKKRKRRRPKINEKSAVLLELVANVNDAMVEMEGDGKRSDWAESKEIEMDSSARRLLHGFEALVGILLQFSDELELMSTFAKNKDQAAIEALEMLLSFAPIIDDVFVQLNPILQHYVSGEIDEEMNDFLFGMNLIVDLLCELTHDVGERQEWNLRANTAYSTLLELLSRDTLEVCCIFEDVDTPDYELTETIEDAWAGTGHEEEFKILEASNDLVIFRQICYDVLLSTDQWCPDTKTLMEICGIDDSMLEEKLPEPTEEQDLAETPDAALQVLEKISNEGLPRTTTMARILRRVLPTDAIYDPLVIDKVTSLKTSIRVPLGLPSSNLVAISSVPEILNDHDALGVAGVGKTTLAAMVANHKDVRRFFNDGIAWIHIGRQEMTYLRYLQCLRELVSQLNVPEDEEPLFPELLHVPGESKAKRRRREEGFMLFVRDIMVEFLKFRNVLIILDDLCIESDLDWFDFDPAALLPDDAEEEFTCVILVTTRCRNLLPAADTVEVDMLEEGEAVELLIQESGELSNSLVAESTETRSVVLECANHPLAVKSVGRWLELKHTAGVVSSAEEIHEDVVKSMENILKSGNQEDADMMYEILDMSLSPAINGEPTNIIKFCFAAFVLVFCEQKHLSDYTLRDASPIIPLSIAESLFEALLDLEEETLLQEGSLFHAQKKEAAAIIPEALSALGVLKRIVTLSEATNEGEQGKEIEEKHLQVMHAIQEEYGDYLCEEDASLAELTVDAERRWNRAFAQHYLDGGVEWATESPDAGLDYALEMVPCHMIRGGMLLEASKLLSDETFVRARLFALGREDGTRRHIKDCEHLFDVMMEQRVTGRKKYDPKGTMRQAYQVLGGLLNMDEDEFIAAEGSPEALEVARSHYEIGFSLAEKRCWEAAIAHWESSQELLVSSLGMVEVVAAIQLNVGVVYAEMNELEQALGSLKQCLRIRGAIHGEEHILYAQTIQKIGDIFLGMSDYHEAMESYNWALDVMHIEPAHHRIDIGDILENMGNIHYSKGEIEEALQCYQDALRSKQVDLGEDHPELSSTYHHIGNCLSDQGKTEEAIAHFEEAIRLKEMDPDGDGERDADVLTIEGVLHNLNGRQQEGLECYEKALQILVTKVPHKKEKVASLLHLIGCVYLMSGEHKKAMKLFEESLQARRKVLGFVHLDVASTLFNMAFLHQTRNRLDKALKCLEEALKIRQLRLPDSEKVAVTHEKIGTLARSIGKTKKAEIMFGEALRIRKLIHGDSHEAVATVLQELGDLMDDLGEYDEAMKYYVEALDIRQIRLGPDDLAVAETLYSMGFTLQNNEASERALSCFEESLSIRKFQLGEDAKEVGDTLNMMGFLQAQRGELDEALSLLWGALRIRKLQEDHIKVSETLKNIGNVHREKQEFELAIECYEECLRIRRAELGDDHEKVADALIAMGNVQSDMECIDEAMASYEDGKWTVRVVQIQNYKRNFAHSLLAQPSAFAQFCMASKTKAWRLSSNTWERSSSGRSSWIVPCSSSTSLCVSARRLAQKMTRTL